MFPRKVVVLSAVGALAILFPGANTKAADAKKEAPTDIALTSLDGGKKVHLRELRGKPVVLNIWATWCLPCREEMPMMVGAEKVWGQKGVLFVGASLDDNKTRQNIPAFVKEFQVTFPIWTGATLDDLARLRLGEAVPDTAFLDSEGAVFARVRGEIRRTELDERLEWVTGDRTRPAPQPLVVHLDK